MPAFLLPIFGFFGGLITRLLGYFGAIALAGTAKTLSIYLTLFAAVFTAITFFITWFDGFLVDFISSLSISGGVYFSSFASFLPSNMPLYISILVNYFVFSFSLHAAIEFARFKSRMLNESTKIVK